MSSQSTEQQLLLVSRRLVVFPNSPYEMAYSCPLGVSVEPGCRCVKLADKTAFVVARGYGLLKGQSAVQRRVIMLCVSLLAGGENARWGLSLGRVDGVGRNRLLADLGCIQDVSETWPQAGGLPLSCRLRRRLVVKQTRVLACVVLDKEGRAVPEQKLLQAQVVSDEEAVGQGEA